MALSLKEILADIKINKKIAFINLLLTLLVLGLLACVLYTSVLLLPFITGTMGLILLTLAIETLIVFILRMRFTLLNFNQNQYLAWLNLIYILPNLQFITIIENGMQQTLFVSPFILLFENNLSKTNKALLIYAVFARFTALILGIYLAAQIVPFIIGAVVATGITYGMAIVFSLVAAATIIYLTDLLLNLPLHIHNLFSLMTTSWESFFKNIEALGYVALGIYFSTLVFPLAMNLLLPLLPHGLLIFTALAVSIGVFFLTVRSISLISQGLTAGFKGLWNLMFGDEKAAASSSMTESNSLIQNRNPNDARKAAESADQLLASRVKQPVITQSLTSTHKSGVPEESAPPLNHEISVS